MSWNGGIVKIVFCNLIIVYKPDMAFDHFLRNFYRSTDILKAQPKVRYGMELGDVNDTFDGYCCQDWCDPLMVTIE